VVRIYPRNECDWVVDPDGAWSTSCGHLFEFSVGGPRENHFEFCPYCAGALVLHYAEDVVAQHESEADDLEDESDGPSNP
jgi:hypothetical protein